MNDAFIWGFKEIIVAFYASYLQNDHILGLISSSFLLK